MAQETRIDVSEVVRHFESPEETRSSMNRLHPLNSVVVMSLLAVPMDRRPSASGLNRNANCCAMFSRCRTVCRRRMYFVVCRCHCVRSPVLRPARQFWLPTEDDATQL